MGYRNKTHLLDCAMGGFSYDKNVDKIPFEAMVVGTRNINLHKGGRGKRGGTEVVNETPIGGTPRQWGVFQARFENGDSFILTADANGEILKDYNDASPLKTGLTINRMVHFVMFNNLVYICTGNDLPQVWTGTGATTNIAAPPVDWSSGANYPGKMVVHGRGSSERLWALDCKVEPSQVYSSKLNTGDGSTEADFLNSGALLFNIETGDGFGIINGVEFGDRLILAGKEKTFIIDDTDVDTSNWGYAKSQWEGGTGSNRLFVAVENDIVSMDEFGTIFSVVTSQRFGDYQSSTLARTKEGAPFIDEYIRENIRMLSIQSFHMTYDPVLRQIYIFVVRQGQTDVDTALCYFIDRGPVDGWVIKDNLNSDSGFKASCSALIREDVGDYKVYTGGMDDGNVWSLESAALNDNGAAYSAGFRTPRGHSGDPRGTKRYDQGRILTDAKGEYTLFIDIYIDGVLSSQESVSLAGTGGTYGSSTYSGGASDAEYGGGEVIEKVFPIHKVGKRKEYHVFNNNVNEDFFVSQILTDEKHLAKLAG